MDRNTEQTASPASDRILDRKIESRALQSGFSSNLGRRAPVGDKSGGPKSVRAIVDWLEKTSTSGPETLPKVRTPDSWVKSGNWRSFSLSSNTAKPDLLQARSPETAVLSPFTHPETPPTHPEEYSLTLLGYKSYFNNRPLARCLDDVHGVTSPAARSTTPKATSASSCYSSQKLDRVMAALQEMRDRMDPGSPTPVGRSLPKQESRSVNGNGNGVHAALGMETGANDCVSELEHAIHTEGARRDPAEVRAF